MDTFTKDIPDMLDAILDTDIGEFWEAFKPMAETIGNWTGTPVNSVENTVSGVVDVINGDIEYPIRRIIGYSEWALRSDGYDLTDLPYAAAKKIKKMMGDTSKSNEDIKKVWDELLEKEEDSESYEDLFE